MVEFKNTVLTHNGIALLAKALAEKKEISFTRVASGDGEYTDADTVEVLMEMESLRAQKQEFAPSSVERQNKTNVIVNFTVTNKTPDYELEHGYYVREIGLFALDPDEGEILYAIACNIGSPCHYMPAYDGFYPATMICRFLIEVANAEDVTIMTDLSAYALASDLDLRGDKISYDEGTGKLRLMSGDNVLAEVTIKAGGGPGDDEASAAEVQDIIDGTWNEEDWDDSDDTGQIDDDGSVITEATDDEIEDLNNSYWND